MDGVWVFLGERGTLPSAVFSTRERAEAWIAERRLTGCLTRYPIDRPVYEWAIESGLWAPSKPHQVQPSFIGRFSSASLDHAQYEDGVCRAG